MHQASDNNDPIQYAANLANKLKISPDTQIGTLKGRIDDFANAVSNNEGYQDSATQNTISTNNALSFHSHLNQRSRSRNNQPI